MLRNILQGTGPPPPNTVIEIQMSPVALVDKTLVPHGCGVPAVFSLTSVILTNAASFGF